MIERSTHESRGKMINLTEGIINSAISFTCYGMQVKDDQGLIKLEPSKAENGVFLIRREGPLAITATNDKLTINYGGEYLFEIESSEEKGHVLNLLDNEGNKKYVIRANEPEIMQDFDQGKIDFDDGGRQLALYLKDKEVQLEISLQVEGFKGERKLKYSEVDVNKTFSVEMRSRSEMNMEEINKVEKEFLEANRGGTRSVTLGIGQNAVEGAIKRSFSIFREHNLQVIKDGVPVIEL